MKKEMLFSVVLLLSTVALAEKEESVIDAEKAGTINTITYSFTVVRESAYDQEAWTKLVELVSQAIKCGIASEEGDLSNDELMDATLKSIKESYSYAGKEGIRGNFNVSMCGGLAADIWFGYDNPTKGCDGICGGDDPKDR